MLLFGFHYILTFFLSVSRITPLCDNTFITKQCFPLSFVALVHCFPRFILPSSSSVTFNFFHSTSSFSTIVKQYHFLDLTTQIKGEGSLHSHKHLWDSNCCYVPKAQEHCPASVKVRLNFLIPDIRYEGFGPHCTEFW